ncbi:hypothetical protein Tco_0767440 [Tanacetum coccineum]
MLNKDNYVPWSSRLLRYAKSKPNGKLIYNSIMHGPYVRRMIPEPGDPDSDDQAIKTILMGLPKDICAAVDSCKTSQEIWESIESYHHRFSKLMNDFKRNKHFPEKIPVISNPTTAINMELVRMANAFKLNYSTPSNNNQRISSNPRNRQIAQPSIQNVGNQNGLIVILGIDNQNVNRNGNGNIVAARSEGNGNGNRNNGNHGILMRLRKSLQTAFGWLILHQASTSGTQTDKAPVYDSDRSAENDSNVISAVSSVEQCRGTVEQNPTTVNRKMKETNADLTIELERCYQKTVYQEQFLTKKINALHLSSAKMITTLNEEIANLNNQLSKEKSTVSYLQQEKKKLKSDFKIREDELLDKQIQLENKIKELDNILVKTGQSIQTMHMLSPKPDSFYHTEQKMALGYQNPFYLKQAQQKQQSLYNGKVLLEKHDPPAVYDSKETLPLAQESRLKMKQLNKEIKPSNYAKINHLSNVFVSQKAKSHE